MIIERVQAYDDHRSRFRHLRPLSWVQVCPTNFVAFHFLLLEDRLDSDCNLCFAAGDVAAVFQGSSPNPSAAVRSQSPHSSAAAAISLAVASQESFSTAGPTGRSMIPSLRSSIMTASPIRYQRKAAAGNRTPRELPIRAILSWADFM
jgi:hypothetical protein